MEKRVFVRIPQINGAPGFDNCANTRELHVMLAPGAHIKKITTRGLKVLTSDKILEFRFSNQVEQYIVIILVETRPKAMEIARLALPLAWFPTNIYVNETFPMRPLVPEIAPLIACVDVHISDNGMPPFTAAPGDMLVVPAYREFSNTPIKIHSQPKILGHPTKYRKRCSSVQLSEKPIFEELATDTLSEDSPGSESYSGDEDPNDMTQEEQDIIGRPFHLKKYSPPVLTDEECVKAKPRKAKYPPTGSMSSFKIEVKGSQTDKTEKKHHHHHHNHDDDNKRKKKARRNSDSSENKPATHHIWKLVSGKMKKPPSNYENLSQQRQKLTTSIGADTTSQENMLLDPSE